MSYLIAALDNQLARDSEEITLRLVVGTDVNVQNVDVKCRARVDALTNEQLIAGIKTTDLNVIISPTQINQAQWPGGQMKSKPSPFNIDDRVPRVSGPYKAIVRGQIRTIAFCDPKYANDGELVRINMRVTG